MKQAVFLSARLAALRGESRLSAAALLLHGMSDDKVRLLLNNIGAAVRTYVEVGSYMGASLLAAAHANPHLAALGIDNFSEHFEVPDSHIRSALHDNVSTLAPHARVIEADFKRLDPGEVPADIDCMFYDGAHDYDSQYLGVVRFGSRFADECILMVDDWNGEQVRNGTYDGLADLAQRTGHVVEFSAALCDTWNNVGVFVLRRS